MFVTFLGCGQILKRIHSDASYRPSCASNVQKENHLPDVCLSGYGHAAEEQMVYFKVIALTH